MAAHARGEIHDVCYHLEVAADLFDGETLETIRPEYDIPESRECEDRAFLKSVETRVKDRNNIEFVLNSAKLLDALYESAEKHREISFED